jgi:hypothetical protein
VLKVDLGISGGILRLPADRLQGRLFLTRFHMEIRLWKYIYHNDSADSHSSPQRKSGDLAGWVKVKYNFSERLVIQ